jgi:ATP-dependent helicase/nuclease subunit B
MPLGEPRATSRAFSHVERSAVKSTSTGPLIAATAQFVESAAAASECILIAATHSAGEEVAHGIPQIAGLHRFTLVRLALEWARAAMIEQGLAPLSRLGQEALAARIVHAERADRELDYLKPVASTPGFARALARTIGELRMSRTRPADLARAGAAGGDLARLLARFEAELETLRLADIARVFEIATAEIATPADAPPRWRGLPVALLDVPVTSPAQREFLKRVAAQSPRIFAAVRGADRAIEGILGVTAVNLDRKPETALEHLRLYLFSDAAEPARADPGAFEIFSAPGEALEAVEIARRITRLAREGRRFDNVAILLRNPERYQPMIEDALRRAQIPAYFSRGTARPDPAGRAFLALVACAAEKCSASRFAEYLSLGQIPAAGSESAAVWIPPDDEMMPVEQAEIAGAPVDESRVARAPARWERLLTDAAVIGGRDRWRRRLAGLERELDLQLKTVAREDEARREEIARRLDQLRELARFALPLIDVLDALPRAARWSEWIEKLSSLARTALRRPEAVLAALAEFEPMGEVGPASLEEVASVLSDRLRFLRRDPPRRRYGRVFVGAIDEARGREFAVVFLPGLAEGLFPQRVFEDPLLLDDARRALDAALATRQERTEQERERLQLAAGVARDRLIASYPRMDVAEARPRVPSFYALELPRAIEGRLPRLKEFEERTRTGAPARLNWPAPADASESIDDAEYDLAMLARESVSHPRAARYLVESNAHLARSLRARWKRWESPKWCEADGLITHDAAALAVLGSKRLRESPWSASSLQQFAACPYRFALHGIFGIRPREESAPIEQMDPLTRGGLFHEVQFALLNELRRAGFVPVVPANVPDALACADRVLDEVAAQYKEKLAPAIERVWSSEIEDLRTDLRGWLQHVAANDEGWVPAHFEFGFGLAQDASRDACSQAQAAELDGVKLRGSIDLVERHASRGVLRVTDHKTGKLPDTTPYMVGGGRYLQPLLYGMAAEKLLGATVECGRLFFATQQGGYQVVEIPVDERRRAFLKKLLSNIDGAIAEGFLPAAPLKEVCESCDYREACGPYEEQRAAKKDRRDERLEPLIEIRGMA